MLGPSLSLMHDQPRAVKEESEVIKRDLVNN